jgi:hypothetical protein
MHPCTPVFILFSRNVPRETRIEGRLGACFPLAPRRHVPQWVFGHHDLSFLQDSRAFLQIEARSLLERAVGYDNEDKQSERYAEVRCNRKTATIKKIEFM